MTHQPVTNNTTITLTTEKPKMKELKKINFASYDHLAVKNARVMIVPIKLDYGTSKGGVLLTPDAENKQTFQHGVVVRVGVGHYMPDGNLLPLDYTVGDFVYYNGSEGIGTDFKIRRGEGEFETVTVLGIESIYFVDGTGGELYGTVG